MENVFFRAAQKRRDLRARRRSEMEREFMQSCSIKLSNLFSAEPRKKVARESFIKNIVAMFINIPNASATEVIQDY